MDDDTFEFNAPTTMSRLCDMANTYDDGADQFFAMVEKMEGAKSEPNIGNKKIPSVDHESNFEENKENVEPDNELEDRNINAIAHQLIRSAKKSRLSKLNNRQSITVDGIELELPRIKHHAMITRLDQLENTPKIDLRTRSVVKSEYKYEHIKSGSQDYLMLDNSSNKFMSIAEKVRNFFNNTPPRFRSKPNVITGSNVFKPRKLISSALEPSHNSNDSELSVNILPNKRENDVNQTLFNQNVHFNTPNVFKMPASTKKINIVNSQGGVQVIENKQLGHGGIRVHDKQLHTVPKPFSFESRKSVAVKPQAQDIKSTEQWVFKARPATVLKKKPFVPKTEKKFTEPTNIKLNTERRAQEWILFEQEMKEKFSYNTELIKKRQEENEKKEIKEIKSLRQQTIHKAEPIKKYKPVLIKKSERPVTIPKSPRFSVRPVRCGLNSICQ